MKSPAFSVCVYCGSRPGDNPAYAEAAVAVGRWIAQHGGRLVYGGGRNGLMGMVADAALNAGGQVLGIIPESMVQREWAHDGCSELLVVDTMHQRKQLMAEHANAFLALPGGIGTLEELFEAWTWRQLGYHDKPVGILNVAGYFDRLVAFMNDTVGHGFMGQQQMSLVCIDSEPVTLLEKLVQAAGFPAPDHLEKI